MTTTGVRWSRPVPPRERPRPELQAGATTAGMTWRGPRPRRSQIEGAQGRSLSTSPTSMAGTRSKRQERASCARGQRRIPKVPTRTTTGFDDHGRRQPRPPRRPPRLPHRRRRRRSRRRSPRVHRAPMPEGTATARTRARATATATATAVTKGRRQEVIAQGDHFTPHEGRAHGPPFAFNAHVRSRCRRRWDQRARGRGDAGARRSQGRATSSTSSTTRVASHGQSSHLPALVSRAGVGRAREGGSPGLARARRGYRRAADRVHGPPRARRDVRGRAGRVRRRRGIGVPDAAALRFGIRADGRGLLQPEAGISLADRARRAFATVARRHGATFDERARVESLAWLDANRVVVTAGGWAKPLLAAEGIALDVASHGRRWSTSGSNASSVGDRVRARSQRGDVLAT